MRGREVALRLLLFDEKAKVVRGRARDGGGASEVG
jgi:hypothetical protein